LELETIILSGIFDSTFAGVTIGALVGTSLGTIGFTVSVIE